MIVSFDTSMLIKVYLEETGSTDARQLWTASNPPTGSVLLLPEMLATFSRKLREGADPAKISSARTAFETDWRAFASVPLDTNLYPICRRLLDVHPLRGADAVTPRFRGGGDGCGEGTSCVRLCRCSTPCSGCERRIVG